MESNIDSKISDGTSRTYIKELKNKAGQEVSISGWVDVRRDHGKLIFIDIRDVTGKVQCVTSAKNEVAYAATNELRPEWVVTIKGKVSERPEKMVNKDEENGSVELQIEEILVLNTAETPPINITSDGKEIGEENRLKYRYLDLRRERMQKNIYSRHQIVKFIRDFLDKESFIEIETPILTKSTPEGARDYIVPSRLEKGKFYALPQSPQQYKQLLMVAGFEKYFQIARCFRDEDTRADRQPEFTQLDMEMSFVKQEDVIKINEDLLIKIVTELFPEKRIQEVPFPRISYKEAIEKYGTDRPDIRKNKNDRNLLAFCWVIDFPFFEKTDRGDWTFTHNPFSAPKLEHMEWFMGKEHIGEILATQYDIVLNGFEIGGGSIRNHNPEALKKVFEIMDYTEQKIQENFGHILHAFLFGTPPHGGIAWGLDRLIALLLNEVSIREVIAFAKTGEGRDLMMNAPSDVSLEQLKDLGLEPKNK